MTFIFWLMIGAFLLLLFIYIGSVTIKVVSRHFTESQSLTPEQTTVERTKSLYQE